MHIEGSCKDCGLFCMDLTRIERPVKRFLIRTIDTEIVYICPECLKRIRLYFKDGFLKQNLIKSISKKNDCTIEDDLRPDWRNS